MIVKTKSGLDIVLNEEQIVRVVVENAGQSVELTYATGASSEAFGPDSFRDETAIPNMVKALEQTKKFTPLGSGYVGKPAEYVNFALVRRTELTKEVAIVIFPNGDQREYRGKDRETISLRVLARAGV